MPLTRRANESEARIAIDDFLAGASWDPHDKSQVGTEVVALPPDQGPRFASRAEARPFDTHAPGASADEIGWMPVPGHVRLTRDHYVVRVSGHSMEATIPDGSYCLFRADRGGSRDGKLLLVWHPGRRANREPGGNLIDFIRAALGILRLKTREEKLEAAFRTPRQAEYLFLLKNRGIATGQVRLEELFEPPLSILGAAGLGVSLFGEEGLRRVVDDVSAGVSRRQLRKTEARALREAQMIEPEMD